jgi:flavin reductase (DIM6/NTAB) family NADH-FMN oxidoreductase RutF
LAGDLRAAFRRHAAGVAVITTSSAGGPVGFTVNSLASVSAAPPLLSFNIARTSSSWEAVGRAEFLGVHLLGSGQEELAGTFARHGADRFARPTSWICGPFGVPQLAGCLVRMIARVEERWPIGDHTIVVAEVVLVELAPAGKPLLYQDGGFRRLSPD